jgi:hypothetical protein
LTPVLIDCINDADVRQTFYDVNNIYDLFTDEEIDDDVCNFFLEDLPVLDEFEKDLCD